MGHRSNKHILPAADRQHARIALRFGERTHWSGEIDISAVGLLAIGALVGMTLLSTAVVVRAANGKARSTG